MRNKTLPLAPFLLLILGCCAAPAGRQESGIKTPTSWNSVPNYTSDAPLVVDDAAQVEQRWWRHFKDETLDYLLASALENNKTLGIAETRITEARAARLAIWSLFFPQISLTGDAQSGNQGFFTNGQQLSFLDAAIQATWEIDLFGKNQNRLYAAIALVQTEEIRRQAVMVGLLAEVARTYFDLRNYQTQIAITEQNLETQRQTLKLTQEQFEGALASDFDVQRAGAQVSTTEARLPSLRIAYGLALNRLNVLLGDVPGVNDYLLEENSVQEPLDQKIIVAAPATVLAARPDVRAAERRFAATISEYTAATKEYLPNISLLGFYGIQQMTLFNTAPTWNVVANVVQPLLTFGRIESDILAAGARESRAFLEYQQTVLEALQNMEDALTSYLHEINRNGLLRKAVAQNQKAEELARQQYTNGFTGLLDVLIEQRNTLETESGLADSDARLRIDLVNIYTASGGGWAIEPEGCD